MTTTEVTSSDTPAADPAPPLLSRTRVAIATYRGQRYAFVGSERGNFVNVYSLSDPTKPWFLQMLPSLPGPEGLLPIPERGLFVVSSESDDASVGIRAGVQVFSLDKGAPDYPQITASHEPLTLPRR